MKIVDNIINQLDVYFSKNENTTILKLKHNLETKNLEIKDLKYDNVVIVKDYNDLERERSLLIEEINDLSFEYKPERKTVNIFHPTRSIITKDFLVETDPRIFFVNDNTIPKITGKDNDEKAKKSLDYVKKNIKYKTDIQLFKEDEQWLFPFETLALKKGDCEDGAILMANIMKKSGIPFHRIRINAGNVKGGGHAYVTYRREKDELWYIMDWCYWPTRNWKRWKTAKNYFGIWFSFDSKYIYQGEKFDRN